MDFTFTNTVPPKSGRNTIDHANAEELVNACIDNPGKWAQVPITYLYPEVEGAERTKLRSRAGNLANRINSGAQSPFDAYDTEAKSRGTDIYIRINMTQRRRRQLDDF